MKRWSYFCRHLFCVVTCKWTYICTMLLQFTDLYSTCQIHPFAHTFIHWRQRLPCRGPTRSPGAIWGSAPRSRLLWHAASRATATLVQEFNFKKKKSEINKKISTVWTNSSLDILMHCAVPSMSRAPVLRVRVDTNTHLVLSSRSRPIAARGTELTSCRWQQLAVTLVRCCLQGYLFQVSIWQVAQSYILHL